MPLVSPVSSANSSDDVSLLSRARRRRLMNIRKQLLFLSLRLKSPRLVPIHFKSSLMLRCTWCRVLMMVTRRITSV